MGTRNIGRGVSGMAAMLALTLAGVAHAGSCAPIASGACGTVPVSQPFALTFDALTFDAPAGGLAGTGFTMVQTHAVNRYPAAPSVPALPGHEPSLLQVTGGLLVITSTRGSFDRTQAQNSDNNTQVNALGVGVTLPGSGITVVSVDVVTPPLPSTNNGEQAGLWFGLNEDNYVRLDVINRTGAGAGTVELRREIGGVSSEAASNVRTADVTSVDTATLHLILVLDPANAQVSGRYTSSNGETGRLGPLSVPAAFFTGQTLPDGSTGPVALAGVYASSRFNAATPALPFAFDNFAVGLAPFVPPVANADALQVIRGSSTSTLTSGASSVLANDTDADGDPLTAVLVTGPANGTLTLNANGTFAYTHNGSNTGSDSFAYRAHDGLYASNTVTVSITVAPRCGQFGIGACSTVTVPIDPPFVLGFDAPAGGASDTGFTMIQKPAVNRFPATPSVPTLPGYEPSLVSTAGGRLTLTSTRGSFQLTQAQGNSNNTQINALGVGLLPTAAFAISSDVIDLPFPDATNAEAGGIWFGLDEDNFVRLEVQNRSGAGAGSIQLRREIAGASGAGAADVRNANARGVNTATIQLRMQLDPVSNVVLGRWTSSAGESGTLGPLTLPASFFLGVALPDSAGNASFAGVFSSSRTNTVTPALPFSFDNFRIAIVTGTPVANPDALVVPTAGGSRSLLTGGATSVLANDSDPDGETLVAALVNGPANGTLTLNADGTFIYTHNGNAATSDSFTYRSSDGFLQSPPTAVSIRIGNAVPVAADDAYTVAEGAVLARAAADGVRSNDTDPDGDALTAVLLRQPAHGTLQFGADGAFVYTHDGSESTADTFTYRVEDGIATSNVATVTLTITPVNDAPVAFDDSYTVAEGATLTVPAPGVLANDTDAEPGALTAVLVQGPQSATMLQLSASGGFTYTHNGSEGTADSFAYAANDGAAFSNIAAVSITVLPVNDAPRILAPLPDRSDGEGDAVTIALGGVFVDDDSAPPTLSLAGDALPDGIGLVGNSLVGTLGDGSAGSYVIDVVATDADGPSTTDRFAWTVTDVPFVPLIFRDGFE